MSWLTQALSIGLGVAISTAPAPRARSAEPGVAEREGVERSRSGRTDGGAGRFDLDSTRRRPGRSQPVLGLDNSAPVIDPIPDPVLTEGEHLLIQVSATDADGDPVSVVASQLPAGARFDPETLRLEWIPSSLAGDDAPTVYDGVTLTVSDGTSQSSLEFSITVHDEPDLMPFVATLDGLRLSFNEDGTPAGLRFEERDLPIGAEVGGVFVEEYTHLRTETGNLLTNGDFETGQLGGLPQGWSVLETAGDVDAGLIDDADEGTFALKLETIVGIESAAIPVVSSPFAVEPFVDHVLSLRAKSPFGYIGSAESWDSALLAVIAVEWLDEQGELVRADEAITVYGTLVDWTTFTVFVQAPARTTEARVGLSLRGHLPNATEGSFELHLDDVRFLPRPDSSVRKIPLATLEQGVDGNNRGFVRWVNEDTDLRLGLDVTFTAEEDHISVDGTIHNLDPVLRERAMDVGFLLPFDGTGRTWHDSILEPVPILEESDPKFIPILANAVSAETINNEIRMSVYPLSAITGEEVTVAISVPTSVPQVHHMVYLASSQHFAIRFALGLSDFAYQPGESYFMFDLFAADPEWGFRSALDKLYDIFPESFSLGTFGGEPVRVGGNLIDALEFPEVVDPEEFGIYYARTFEASVDQSEEPVLQEIEDAGVLALLYTRPGDETISGLDDGGVDNPPPSYADVLDEMDRLTDPGSRLEASSNSLVGDPSGIDQLSGITELQFTFANEWSGRFPTNANPAVPLQFGDKNLGQFFLEKTNESLLEQPLGLVDGELVDGAMTTAAFLDYDPAHLAATQYPLTYGFAEQKPAVHLMSSIVEYLEASEKLREESGRERFILPNLNATGRILYAFPFADSIGYEAFISQGEIFNWPLTASALRRSIGYRKPIAARPLALSNGSIEATITSFDEYREDYLRPAFDRWLLHAVFPATAIFFSEAAEFNPEVFDDALENSRDLHRQYIPVFESLQLAGWEPITHAVVTPAADQRLHVERYGPTADVEGIYFVIYHEDEPEVSAPYSLAIDLAALGIAEVVSVTDALTGQPLAMRQDDDLIVSGRLDGGRSVVCHLIYVPE